MKTIRTNTKAKRRVRRPERHVNLMIPNEWFGPAMTLAETLGIPRPRSLTAKVLLLIREGMMAHGVDPDKRDKPDAQPSSRSPQ